MPGLALGALRAASWAFRAGTVVRGALYRARVFQTARAPIPVISIGNLTTGGTGKTPLAITLAGRLLASGEKVAVLARGYGAPRPGGLNDELELIRARLPGVMVYAGADRVTQAAMAARDGATVAILDDGFQHRRLVRDVDILVIDALDPFGTGPSADGPFLLPRGLMREPLSAARRATAILISRASQAGEDRVRSLRSLLEESGVAAPTALVNMEPSGLRPVAGSGSTTGTLGLEDLRSRKVVLLSGIGNPAAFEATVKALGAKVERAIVRPDHHDFRAEDLAEAHGAADGISADMILVTEKDAQKLAPLVAKGASTRPVHALAVDARIVPSPEAEALLARVDAAARASHPALDSRLDSRGLESRESSRSRATREAFAPGGAP